MSKRIRNTSISGVWPTRGNFATHRVGRWTALWRLFVLLTATACSGEVGLDDADEVTAEPWPSSSETGPATTDATTPGSVPSASEVSNPPELTNGDTSGDTTDTTDVVDVHQNPAIAPTSFECDPEVNAPALPLRRLSKQQYENTVVDLVTRVLGEENTERDAARALLTEVPPDERLKLPQELHGTYRRLDQRVQQPHVDAWYTAGVQVGQWLSAGERLTALLGSCAESAGAEAESCIDGFIERFGRLAFRRPLSEAEIDFYRGFYAPSTGIDAAGVADVVAGFLNAPDFLYLVEGRASGSTGVGSDALTAHELAARLSYHFWNTLPDAQLSELADDGTLLEPDVYEAQVERLFADERTAPTMAEFYREWLRLEELQPLNRNNGSSLFQAFAADNLPTDALHAAATEEALALLDYYTFREPGGVADILTTPYSFASSAELAALYGVDVWDGVASPPLLGARRPGLLTRGAFLMTGTANTRPIMRGLFIRTALLCDAIDPPPAAAGAAPPELSPDWTTREVVEQLTAPAACSGCHNLFINPLGFALEGFDSLARERSEQRLYDESGNEIGAKPIDASSVPQVVLGDLTPSTGPGDLMDQLSSSGKVEACLARQYFRFTFGRWESVRGDACALEEMRETLSGGGDFAGLLRQVALSDAFRTRVRSEAPATEEL